MARIIRTCKAIFATVAACLASFPVQAAVPDMLAYLRARAADGDGAADIAAAHYAIALAAAPGDRGVATHAYREAIAAGDIPLALRAATALGSAAPADADLLILANAVAAQDDMTAGATLSRITESRLRILAGPLEAWAALEHGGDPLPPLAVSRDDMVARRFAAEARSLVLIAQGNVAEGLASLRAMLGNGEASEELRIAAARLLIGAGRTEQAQSLLTAPGASTAGVNAGSLAGAVPGLAFGASALFTRVASDLSAGQPGPMSLVLSQAAVVADPANGRAKLLLANALAKHGLADRALATLKILESDPVYRDAALAGRVSTLAGADRLDLALGESAKLIKHGDDAALLRHANLLARVDRPAEAATIYRGLIDRSKSPARWPLWLQYGAMLDEAGDWPAARQALKRAVEAAPDEPVALNYLAYARVIRGEAIVESIAMLEKAHRLRPDDAAIADSLGWAYHVSADSARALPLIEKAAIASPANEEIGEHLGDVYWALGRRFEARYAWRAAAVMADEDTAARLSAKIANGPARLR